MHNPWVVAGVTAALIILSAFFVIIEFALLGARRHRLEAEAATSRAARAALRSMNELTIMLAGAQLGITLCTFALGAVTEPAIHHAIGPLLERWGLPSRLSDGLAFALALLVVTFLHLVVGEMAPKSWAIAHPERSAKLVALPARGFIALVRPLLRWINRIANRLVTASGIKPVDRAASGRDAETLRYLVEHSASVGALDASLRAPLSGLFELRDLTIGQLVHADAPTSVPATATVGDVQDAAARSGHLRILLDAPAGSGPGVVHVRDTLVEPRGRAAGDLARPAVILPPDTPVPEALAHIRSAGEQLAAVMEDGQLLGVVTVSDVLRRVLPERPVERPQ